jgi:hypothetical protein
MTIIAFENERLVINCDDDRLSKGILKVSLMSEAGFHFDQEKRKFVLPPNRDSESSLEYVIGLLKEENIPYHLDERSNQMLVKIEDHLQNFRASVELGNKIKTSNANRILKPPGFLKPLFETQQQAVALHIHMPFSADFSVPGSGKTWIGYATFSIFKSRGDINRLLIVGPISSFETWKEEFKLIFGISAKFAEIRGTIEDRTKIYENYQDHEILLISYNSFANDKDFIASMLTKDAFMVILDESHNVKQPDAKRTNAALEIAPLCKRRMILSGTPIPRSIDDLYTQFAFLDPKRDILGEFSSFGELVDQDESLELVKERISPFYYRIRKNAFMPKLPDPIFEKEYVDMEDGKVRNAKGQVIDRVEPAPHQTSIYYGIEGRIFRAIQSESEMKNWNEIVQLQKWQKGRLMRLLEVASNPALLMGEDLDLHTTKITSANLPIYKTIENYSKLRELPVKIQRTVDLVNNILDESSEKKIIIWTSFILNITELKRQLNNFNPVIVHGGIAKNEDENRYFHRVGEIKKFKNDRNCRILIANPASLAESVSLHKNERNEPVCDTAIYMDRTFNGAHYMQSLDRIHRVGLPQNRKVRYIILMSRDTIDQDIDDSLEEKISNMKAFLNDDIQRFTLETEYDDITGGMADKDDYNRAVNRMRKHAEQGKFD